MRRQPKEATMINRREFTAGVVTTLAAPFVLKTGLRAQVTRLRRDVTKLDPSDPLFGKYAEAVKAICLRATRATGAIRR